MSRSESIQEIVADALFNHAYLDRDDFLKKGGALAYYTSAETALKILKNKELWMRSVKLMNDYSEVHHGIRQMAEAWNTSKGVHFWKSLAAISPHLDSLVKTQFNDRVIDLAHDTYLTCLSKIDRDELPNHLGKLSMWRAYGGESGVALILNSTPFQGDSSALGIYSQPVIYGAAKELATQLEHIANKLLDIKKELQEYLSQDENAFKNLGAMISLCIEFLIICLKHPAFREENEWRIICSLKRKGYKIGSEVQSIGGIPQTIMKIPLENDPTSKLIGYDINSLISEVLIGPTQHPATIKKALCDTMRNGGVLEPEQRVRITDIPLRPNNR